MIDHLENRKNKRNKMKRVIILVFRNNCWTFYYITDFFNEYHILYKIKVLLPHLTFSKSFMISISFLLRYVCCTGGIHYENSKWTYILCWLGHPHCLLYDPLSAPLTAIARGSFVLFHISIWSLATIFLHLNLIHVSKTQFLGMEEWLK
jgi:hypothetical protein